MLSNCQFLNLCFFFIQIPGSYTKATKIFEEIARQQVNNNLLKYSAKGTLLNAGICQLCRGDSVAISNALERFQVFLYS
jgi:Soluble NSF attachment protein, SNAP